MKTLLTELTRTRLPGRAAVAATVIRVLAGAVFVVFSLGKFTDTAQYATMFAGYGLPSSSLLVYLAGTVELIGGLMLIAGAGTRLAALALAANMVVAILTAGLAVGGPIHLVLAPTLLVATLFLFWAGPGPLALDNRLARHAGPTPPAVRVGA